MTINILNCRVDGKVLSLAIDCFICSQEPFCMGKVFQLSCTLFILLNLWLPLLIAFNLLVCVCILQFLKLLRVKSYSDLFALMSKTQLNVNP